MSPTQRTIRALKMQGRLCDICERWIPIPGIPGGGKRKDLFGFVDIIALDPKDGIIGIQSCGQDFSGHKKKILEAAGAISDMTDYLHAWLAVAKLELWGWRKVKVKRGGKAMIWQPRIGYFTLQKPNDITGIPEVNFVQH